MAIPMPIADQVPARHRLSVRRALSELDWSSRALVDYPARDLWEHDTRRLPRPLASWRRHLRRFAHEHLAPGIDRFDRTEHPAAGQWRPGMRELVLRAADAGLMTDFFPSPLGSAPLARARYPVWAQTLKTEELASVCAGQMLALCAHQLGLAPMALSGDLRAMRNFVYPVLRDLHRGEPHLCAYAITEPGAGSDAEEGHGASLYRPGVVARRRHGRWHLNGRKVFISGGDVARTIAVFAALEGEGMDSWTCFIVHPHMPGFRMARLEHKMGMRACSAAELEFDDLAVPDSHVVGGLRRGWALNRATLNFSRAPVAGMAVGLARAATEIAMDFACTRRLGAHRLVDFQEVQLQLAQMVAETTAIRSMVWQQAADFTPRQAGASLCKFHATDTAQHVCEMAMDLLGGESLLHQQRIEKVFRDVRLTRIFEGTNQINRLAVIEDMQEELGRHAFQGKNHSGGTHHAR